MSTELSFTLVWMFLVYTYIQKDWLLKHKHLSAQINQKLVKQHRLDKCGRPIFLSKLFNRLMIFIVFVFSFIDLMSSIEFWSDPISVGMFVISCIILLHILVMSALYQVYVSLACSLNLLKQEPQ